MRLALLAAAAAAACDAQQVWTNLWAMPSGMNAVDPELATDGDNATQMRVFGPIRHGASVAVDMRSAVKVTHVLLVEHPVEYLRAGKLTVQKNGRQLTVASWNDEEMGRTRTPGGHTVIALSPPLKLVHAPFVFTIEVAATQSVGWQLLELQVYSPQPPPVDTRKPQGSGEPKRKQVPVRPPPPPPPSPPPPPPPGQRNQGQRQDRASAGSKSPPGAHYRPAGSEFSQQGGGSPKPAGGTPPPPRSPSGNACKPLCEHGQCQADPSAVQGSERAKRGKCVCEDGWIGRGCDSAVCKDCQHGLCLSPGICGCHRGWSGANCNVSGVVSYGSFVQLRSSKRSEHLLFSDRRTRAPGSTAQAVLNWREPRREAQSQSQASSSSSSGSGSETAATSGNWWQVLGPAGTSAGFLFNLPVPAGAHIRLKHVASGAFLRGDGSQPAFTRKDLREVSASDIDRDGVEWQVTVNGTAVQRLVWGLASATALRHVATQDMLTCSGQTYPVSQPEVFGKKHYMVHEVQLQRYIMGNIPFPKDPGFVSAAQVWSVSRYRAPAVSPARSVPFSRHAIIRLASPTSMCYVNYRAQPQEVAVTPENPSSGGGGLGCEATDDMSELWVVVPRGSASSSNVARKQTASSNSSAATCDGLIFSIDAGLSRDEMWEIFTGMKLWQLLEKTDSIGLGEDSVDGLNKAEVVELLVTKVLERRNLAAACRRASAELVPSGSRLQRGSRVQLVHLLTRRVIYWVQDSAQGRARVVALPAGNSNNSAEVGGSDCLRISDTTTTVSGRTEWIAGEPISLQFCGTNSTIQSVGQHLGLQEVAPGATGSDETEWIGEQVRQLRSNMSKMELATTLARVCEEGGAYIAAEGHLTTAINEGNSTQASKRELANIHFGRARIYMRLGRPKSAIGDLVAARKHLPEFAEATLYYGRIATTLGKWDEAHEAFTTVTSNISDDQPLHYRATLYLHQINNISGSMSKATEALQVSMEAYSETGRCDMSDGDREVLQWARRLMTDALQAAPESVDIRVQRAETNLLLGDLGAAKSDATWVIRLSRSSPEGYFLRGRAHLHMFDHDAARSYFRWCVKVDVEHSGCRQALRSLKAVGVHTANASSSFRFGNFSSAVTSYQSAIDASPDHCFHVALMRLQRCRCFIYLNQPDKAVNECRIASALDPELRDAETLERDAKTIANSFQDWVAEELKKKVQKERKEKADEERRQKEAEEKAREAEKERLRKEAEEKGEEFVDPEDPEEFVNRTRIETRQKRNEWQTDRIVKSLALCEQHFYRLNMSSMKVRKLRCLQPKLLHNGTLCQKLRGCSWTEADAEPGVKSSENATEVNATEGSAGESNGTNDTNPTNDTNATSGTESGGSGGPTANDPQHGVGVCAAKVPTTNDVKRSYRRMAMTWHPDKKHRRHAKERAEKVFQTIVESYEFLGDEKQLTLCNAGDVRKAEQHHHKEQKKQEKKQEQQQQQQQKPDEPPKNKPQPGRSKAEPPKQDAPTWSRMDWHVKPACFGLLPEPPPPPITTTEGGDFLPPSEYRHRFSFSVLITRGGQEPASTVTRLSLTGLEAHGHPETLIHWQSARPASVKGNLEDLRKKFGVKDEYGKHTAGDGANGWGDSGAQAEKSWFIPTEGRIQLFFNADDSTNAKGKNSMPDLPVEMRVFNIDIRDYDFAELLDMPNEQSGVSFLRLDIDNRQGPVDVFVGLSRVTTVSEGQTKLRLDSLTAVFSPEYWLMKDSLSRKMGLLTEGGMDASETSSIHYAVDGDNSTTFETAGALEQDQALVVDLQVIYNLRKAIIVEQPGHECHACAIEASVDRLWWWPLHTFTRGVGEEVEWRQRTSTEDDTGIGAAEFPIVARYVRLVATVDEWREHKPHWGVTEFEVFGDELDSSLISDAPIWLEGGDTMTALDEEIVGEDDGDDYDENDDDDGDDADDDEGEVVRRGPLSYATDGDTSTSFVTARPPAGLLEDDALVIDLLDTQKLALIVIWQNESFACSMCMIQRSVDAEEWEDIQLMVHTDGMVVAGFGPDANLIARYIRLAVIEPMQHVWEVIDIEVHGSPVIEDPAATENDGDGDGDVEGEPQEGGEEVPGHGDDL